jgi:hypothetical protein
MRRKPLFPVLQEAEFIAALGEEGATLDIACITPPDPARRHRGEWVFYVNRPDGTRYLLVTAKGRERVVNTMEGVVSFASTALELDTVSVPLKAGVVATGMTRN